MKENKSNQVELLGVDSNEIRNSFLSFFEKKGHKIISSSSLIPDDPSVLLTTAGMQQFKKYFTGELNAEKELGVKRALSVQKCFRTSDIDEVGDKTHLTFFQMLGHFSFGDYFKKETIAWTFELLTDVFKIDPKRITARVFAGDWATPFDKESFDLWSDFLPEEKIRRGPREDNFWGPVGKEGPCGSCNEIYVDGVEVATLVFVEYYSGPNGKFSPLPQKGVDVGWGFERLVSTLNNKDSVFETDIFEGISDKVKEFAPNADEKVKRILMDHLRGASFLIADGVRPSNKEAGYVLRRLIRKILAYSIKYDIHADLFSLAVEIFKKQFEKNYPELKESQIILGVFEEERLKFESAIVKGVKELEKYESISGKDAFYLHESFGLPFEIVKELAPENAVKNLSRKDFDEEFEKHQEISRAGAEKKFGGHGLILDTGELKAGNDEERKKVIRLHTATHLLHQALRDVLGDEVSQRGSDITPERARFDFVFPRKMTSEEIKKVEDIVNEKIKENLSVNFEEMPKEEAEKSGALKFFKGNYPDEVKVYYTGDSLENAYSKEFCGGPHVSSTGEIGEFKIIKEESSSAGIRRIRAAVV